MIYRLSFTYGNRFSPKKITLEFDKDFQSINNTQYEVDDSVGKYFEKIIKSCPAAEDRRHRRFNYTNSDVNEKAKFHYLPVVDGVHVYEVKRSEAEKIGFEFAPLGKKQAKKKRTTSPRKKVTVALQRMASLDLTKHKSNATASVGQKDKTAAQVADNNDSASSDSKKRKRKSRHKDPTVKIENGGRKFRRKNRSKSSEKKTGAEASTTSRHKSRRVKADGLAKHSSSTRKQHTSHRLPTTTIDSSTAQQDTSVVGSNVAPSEVHNSASQQSDGSVRKRSLSDIHSSIQSSPHESSSDSGFSSEEETEATVSNLSEFDSGDDSTDVYETDGELSAWDLNTEDNYSDTEVEDANVFGSECSDAEDEDSETEEETKTGEFSSGSEEEEDVDDDHSNDHSDDHSDEDERPDERSMDVNHQHRKSKVTPKELKHVSNILSGAGTEADFGVLSQAEVYVFEVAEKLNPNIVGDTYKFNAQGALLPATPRNPRNPLPTTLANQFKTVVSVIQTHNQEKINSLMTDLNLTARGYNTFLYTPPRPDVKVKDYGIGVLPKMDQVGMTEMDDLNDPAMQNKPLATNADEAHEVVRANSYRIPKKVFDTLFFGGWFVDKTTHIKTLLKKAHLGADPHATLKERLSYYKEPNDDYKKSQAYMRAKRIEQLSRFLWFVCLSLAISFIVFGALTFAHIIAPPFGFMGGMSGSILALLECIILTALAFAPVALLLGRGLGEAFHFIRTHVPGIWWDDNNANLLRDVTRLGLVVGLITAALLSLCFGLVAGGIAPSVVGVGVVAAVTSMFGSSLIAGIFATIFISSALILTGLVLGYGLGVLFMQAAIRIPAGKNSEDYALGYVEGDIKPGEKIPLQHRYNKLRENIIGRYKAYARIGAIAGGLVGLVLVGLLLDFAPVVLATGLTFWGPVLIGTPFVLLFVCLGALGGALLARHTDPEGTTALDQVRAGEAQSSTAEVTNLLNKEKFKKHAKDNAAANAEAADGTNANAKEESEQTQSPTYWENFVSLLTCRKPAAKGNAAANYTKETSGDKAEAAP